MGIDPGSSGCQTYEATSFLIYQFRFEPSAALVLLQIGVLGESNWPPTSDNRRLRVLAEYLQEHYGPSHEVVIYEASPDPDKQPRIQHASLSRLHEMEVSVSYTLYVPPKGLPPLNSDMIGRLDMKTPSKADEPGAWARQISDA